MFLSKKLIFINYLNDYQSHQWGADEINKRPLQKLKKKVNEFLFLKSKQIKALSTIINKKKKTKYLRL